MSELNKIYNQNCLGGLKNLPDNSIDCCITSPPYFGLRDYGHSDQIGLEETPELYVAKMVEVFTEVRRVLKKEGTLWLNIGDSYAANRGYQVANDIRGSELAAMAASVGGRGMNAGDYGLKPKDLIGIPWMLAFALRSSGWYLRQDIIWHKPNPMPESVTDRCTKAHEYIFLLSKSAKYYYDAEAIKTKAVTAGQVRLADTNKYVPTGVINGIRKDVIQGEFANKRSVWTMNTIPFSEAHFATFPERLIVDMIKAGCPENGCVLDPFMGAGTTALVARKLNRNYIGFELNSEYVKIAEKRLYSQIGAFI